MKKVLAIIIFTGVLVSCGTTKSISKSKANTSVKVNTMASARNLKSSFSGKNSKMVKNLLKDAEKFLGTPYKLGGNNSMGIDCSGLMCQVFKTQDILLPRNSRAQSEQGASIAIEKSQPGDLLFFATSGGNKVSHVGIVHTIYPDGEITFLHASTSKGVIISSLNEKYWNKAFLFVKRMIS